MQKKTYKSIETKQKSMNMICNSVYYRPTWTCGKYDSSSKSALFYNLVRGFAYFFEENSASVVGEILKVRRGEQVMIDIISERTGLTVSEVIEFFCLLEKEGLLSKTPTDSSVVSRYRDKVKDERMKTVQLPAYSEKKVNNAETAYMNRCNSRVVSVVFELTYRCGEKCIHCYNPGATRNQTDINRRSRLSELGLDDYKRIIDELCNEGLARVCLTGGDPLTKTCFWEIVEYLYSKDIAIEVYTNGQLLLGHEERLANYFPCDVGISIYSPVASIHDVITGIKGSLDKSLKVIDNLAAYAIPIEIKCCLMQTNLSTYRGVGEIARRYGAMLQIECSIFDSMDGDKCVSNFLRLNPIQMEVVLQDPDNPIYVGMDNNYGFKEVMMDENACSAGNKVFCITPNGNMILCPSFHASLGNLKNSSVNTILENNKQLEKWQKLTLAEYEECGRHEYCSYCHVCPGLNFAEHGTPLKAGENNCYTAKIRYQLALKLRQGMIPIEERDMADVLEMVSDNTFISIRKVQSKSYYDNNLSL